jgi:hypothetical protein
MSKETWIYLIYDALTGYYKIGKSEDPDKRLKQLKKQDTLQPLPNDFSLVKAWWANESCERELHKFFRNLKVRGEWFALQDYDVKTIHVFFYDNIQFDWRSSARMTHFGQPYHKDEGLLFRNDVFIENANTVDFLLEVDGIIY